MQPYPPTQAWPGDVGAQRLQPAAYPLAQWGTAPRQQPTCYAAHLPKPRTPPLYWQGVGGEGVGGGW